MTICPAFGEFSVTPGDSVRDALERARRRQRLDLFVLDVGADDRRGDRRRRLGDDLHRLGHAGGLHRHVLLDGEPEGHVACSRLTVAKPLARR